MSAQGSAAPVGSTRRDIILIAVAAIAVFMLSARFELSEKLFLWTRAREYYQVDELPGVLLFLALAFAWLAWQRVTDARRELRRRLESEAALASALAENRRLALEILHAQEAERRHLARELHDEFGQCLNAVKLDAVGLRDPAIVDAPERARAASSIIAVVDHLQVMVRERVGQLRPVGLDELGLAAALEHCIDGWRCRLPAVRFELSLPDGLQDCSEAVNMTLYRAVQEGLTNIAKHTRASWVAIRVEARAVRSAAGELVLTMRNDGGIAREPKEATGLGLVCMGERVAQLGGTLRTHLSREGEFCIVAALPLHA